MRGRTAGMLRPVIVRYRFVARIDATGNRGSCAVVLPVEVDAALGAGRTRIALVGTADGRPFRTAAAPTGGGEGRMFLFSKEMQIATGHQPGEDVEFEIAREGGTEKDDGLDDLHEALGKNGKARDAFAALPPSHKREYLEWIAEAKRPQTRAKRIADTVAKLGATAPPPPPQPPKKKPAATRASARR